MHELDELTIVLNPKLHPADPTTPKLLPEKLPDDIIAGGAVISGIGKKNGSQTDGFYIPDDKVYGGGAAGLTVGAGHVIQEAASLFTLTNALIAALVLILLLLIAVSIWLCWRYIPGFCACCPCADGKDDPETGTKKNETEKTHLLENGVTPTNAALAFASNTENEYADENIYNIEGMKVDCVLITKDNKYFVTGSGMGPPKVWDSLSGEIHHLMKGNESGCANLHMACNDTILVGQVVDNVGGKPVQGINSQVRRLQLWDFPSGHQINIPMEIDCTATCIAKKDEYVLIARTTESGPSLLVWNLQQNKRDCEIPYYAYSREAQDEVTYLNVSPDDRLVVAGFQNPADEQAFYMVFDMAANHPPIFQPQYIQFDSKVGATEIISRDLAVTGTRRGELIIWNMHTLNAIDNIELPVSFDTGNPTILSPHSGVIHTVKLSADGKYLVTGAQDCLVRVWSMPDKHHLYTLEGHVDDVLCVAIPNRSEVVVSGSWDGSIRIWGLEDGKQICWFTSNIEILQVKISGDGRFLIALGERDNQRKLITLKLVKNRIATPNPE